MGYTTYKNKKYKKKYRPRTEPEISIRAARLITNIMVEAADERGACVVALKNEWMKRIAEDSVTLMEPKFAVEAEKRGLCEILYNPFSPSIAGVPKDQKLLEYHIDEFLGTLNKEVVS